MAKSRIILPEKFSFSSTIPIRITDINYGGHVGNDKVLSLVHEARVLYLASLGFSEMDLAGVSMIMRDVTIEFKSEIFYGDTITAFVAVTEKSRAGFIIVYKLEKKGSMVAIAQTGMICYDYGKKKIVSLPEAAIAKFSS